MASLSPQRPDSLSLAQQSKFSLTFAKIPYFRFFCQSAPLPGIAHQEQIQPTPNVDLYVPGVKLAFDVFTATFLIDENLQAWTDIFNWMNGLTFPETSDQYLNLLRQGNTAFNSGKNPSMLVRSDATLTINNNSNIPIIRAKFVDMFPVSLSGLTYTTTTDADSIITADVAFRYNWYTIQKLNVQ